MNERIRELATQAGAYWNHEDFNMGLSVEFQEKDLQTFAELIVRECCNQFVELRTRPADLAVKDVKKHFGVE